MSYKEISRWIDFSFDRASITYRVRARCVQISEDVADLEVLVLEFRIGEEIRRERRFRCSSSL